MTFQREGWPPKYTTMYYISLALLVCSLPLSKFTMSIFQFTTLFFWLWHGVDSSFLKDYPLKSLINPVTLGRFLGQVIQKCFWALIEKFIQFFRNKPAMAIASLLLLHALGVIYSTDYNYALKDLRTKVPIFILPLFIATGPRISTKTFYLILGSLIAAVLGGSIYRVILLLKMPVADPRALMTHSSHILYSLNTVFAVFVIFFFVQKKGMLNLQNKILLLALAIWLIAFITYMNYTTGILMFVFLCFLSMIFFTFKIKHLFFRYTLLSAVMLLMLVPAFYVFSIAYQFIHIPAVEFSKLDKHTQQGNSYYHDTVNFKSRKGEWIGLYICDKELRESWNGRSRMPLDSVDPKRQVLRNTLISYLASKQLRKDASGMKSLTVNDIHNIEAGYNTCEFGKRASLRSQIEDFITGFRRYKESGDPNSGSMVQRFEYWRTSLIIIWQHPMIGVGTGDLPKAFAEQYDSMNSKLAKQYRLRSHNQFLSITVGFGIVGIIWFMFVMFYPGIKTRSFNNYFFVVYWIIFMASMLTEDTIESQEGVTFYVLLTALLILGREKEEPSELLYD